MQQAGTGGVELAIVAVQPGEISIKESRCQAPDNRRLRGEWPRLATLSRSLWKENAADGSELKIQRRRSESRPLPAEGSRFAAVAQFACHVVAVGEPQRGGRTESVCGSTADGPSPDNFFIASVAANGFCGSSAAKKSVERQKQARWPTSGEFVFS